MYPPEQNSGAEVMVLLSGGIDSAATLDFYRRLKRPLNSLFVDYGQAAAEQEQQAAAAIAAYYDVELTTVSCNTTTRKTDGFIEGRNAFLFALAIMERPHPVSVIAGGLHSSTKYPDCSLQFLERMQGVAELSGGQSVTLAAPFLEFNKHQIVQYCEEYRVPWELTYSCEAGEQVPCGQCLSCRDRGEVHAQT